MNTGVQDAHNLAWKVAAVLQGAAGEGLLASYQSERRPVAEANTALSVANWNEAVKVPAALGLDPRAATLLSQLASTGARPGALCSLRPGCCRGLLLPRGCQEPGPGELFNCAAGRGGGARGALQQPANPAPPPPPTPTPAAPLPGSMSRALLEGGLALGMRLAGTAGPLAGWRQAQLDKIFAAGHTLRLQFPKEDLGFRWGWEAGLGAGWLAVGVALGWRWGGVGGQSRGAPGARVRAAAAGHRSPGAGAAAGSAPAPTLPPPAAPCRYSKGALCPDDPAAAPHPGSASRDAPFVPSAAPGCRLPHFELQLLPGAAAAGQQQEQQQCSVLDVVADCAASSLLLLLGPGAAAGEAGSAWRLAAQRARQQGRVALNVLQLLPASGSGGSDGGGCGGAPEPEAGSSSGAGGWWRLAVDVGGRWEELSGVGRGGALLVRPDGHVAWRRAGGGGADAAALAADLGRAMAAVFAH